MSHPKIVFLSCLLGLLLFSQVQAEIIIVQNIVSVDSLFGTAAVLEPRRKLMSKEIEFERNSSGRIEAYGNYVYERLIALPEQFPDQPSVALGFTDFEGLDILSFYSIIQGFITGVKLSSDFISGTEKNNFTRSVRVRLVVQSELRWSKIKISAFIVGEDGIYAGSFAKGYFDWKPIESEGRYKKLMSHEIPELNEVLEDDDDYDVVAVINGLHIIPPTIIDDLQIQIDRQPARITESILTESQKVANGTSLNIYFQHSKHLLSLFVSYVIFPTRHQDLQIQKQNLENQEEFIQLKTDNTRAQNKDSFYFAGATSITGDDLEIQSVWFSPK